VKGYAGTKETHLALERGEVEAALSSYSVLRAYWPDWVEQNKVRMLVRNGFERDPELPDVPATVELASTPADRAVLAFFAGSTSIGRAFVAPPDLRPDLLAVLRTGFDATMKDPAFVKESRNARLDLAPLAGDELDRIIAAMMNVDPATRERIRDIAGNDL
jgi:tripartite-type tricarboxylate transporter receptor subunit TctC